MVLLTPEQLANVDEHVLASCGGVDGILSGLDVDEHRGLDSSDVPARRDTFGANVLPVKATRSLFAHFMESFEDATLLILIACAVVQLSIAYVRGESFGESIPILAAVVIVSSVTAVQNYSKDKEFQSLSEVKKDRQIAVRRNGADTSIPVAELVVGDIALLSPGDSVPGDGVVLTAHQLAVDESALTGESLARRKKRGDPVWAGMKVNEGTGLILVTNVGVATHYGQLARSLTLEDPPATPLQDKLEVLAEQIGYVGMACGAATFVALTVVLALSGPEWSKDWTKLLDFFIVGVTIVVVAVPEGLPLAVTIALAFSMRQMLADKNLVRELKACETMGSATVIASDKTGTLTENRMTVQHALVHDVVWSASDTKATVLKPGAAAALNMALAVNSTASVAQAPLGSTTPEYVGNKTEGAMLWWSMQEFGATPMRARETADIVYRVPFSSGRKFMLTVVAGDAADEIDSGSTFAVVAKGAPEVVLPACSAQWVGDALKPLTDARSAAVQKQVDEMATAGMRTIVLATRGLSAAQARKQFNVTTSDDEEAWQDKLGHTSAADETEGHALLSGLSLLAVVGIADPLRPEVPGAIARCRGAGIRVIMVTGDNMATAQSIAAQAGIMRVGGRVLTGRQYRTLPDAERDEVTRDLTVLARSSPSDKKLLVETLQAQDEIVAVTGDGVNDAAALRAAHVGLAMGIAGTEVAKEAADIIITDDNFASITRAVAWGRAVLDNVRKFLTMQLTINCVALTTTLVASMAGRPIPLNATMLLWVNLIMDSAAALALATEPPTDDLLHRAPEVKGTSLITTLMAKNIGGAAVFQVLLLGFLMLSPSAHALFGVREGSVAHTTVLFNVFVWLQFWNMFNARKVHDEWAVFSGVTGSFYFEFIALFIAAGQVAIVQFGGAYAGTVQLGVQQWALCVAVGALSLPVGALLKLVHVNDQAARPVTESTGSSVPLARSPVGATKRWLVAEANGTSVQRNVSSRSRSGARARST